MKCAVVVKHRNKIGYVTDVNEGAKRMSYTDFLNDAKGLTAKAAKDLVDELRCNGLYAFVIFAK